MLCLFYSIRCQLQNIKSKNILSRSQMDCYQIDHLELVLPTQFTKPSSQPSSLNEVNLNDQKKTLKFSMPDEPPALTIVSLSKKKQTIETKPKPTPSSAAKQAIKKITSKFLCPQSKKLIKRGSKKQNLLSKEELHTNIKQSEDRIAKKKRQNLVQSVQFLQIKSFKLDEQLQKLKTERRLSRTKKHPQNSVQNIEKIFFSTQSIDNLGQKSSRSLMKNQTVRVSLGEEGLDRYKNIESKIQEKELKRGKCFYDKLKERLTLQIKQIKYKQQLDRTDPLLTACNMKDFPAQEIKSKFRHAATQRARPRTALTRTALESCKSQRSITRKRPQSTSAKILEKKQLEYMSQKIQEQQQRQIQNYSRIHSTTSKKRRSRVAYSPDSSLTFKHISPMPQSQDYIVSRSELQKQKIKEKMLNILIDCHTESVNHQNLQQGVKVFEKYCQRMDSNLGRASKMIGRIQKTEAFDDEVEYL